MQGDLAVLENFEVARPRLFARRSDFYMMGTNKEIDRGGSPADESSIHIYFR